MVGHSAARVGVGENGSERGIFLGDWSSGDLVFQKMNVQGPPAMFWTTLASCEENLNRVYAAVSDANGMLVSILRHDHADNNLDWEACSNDVLGAPAGIDNVFNSTGDQGTGGWIRTLRVSQANPDVVVLTWDTVFISKSGGREPWVPVDLIAQGSDWTHNEQWFTHMHVDGRTTVFDIDNDGNPIWIATADGRIFSMSSNPPPGGGFPIPFEFTTPRNGNPGHVDRFLIVRDDDTLAYAAYNSDSSRGLILQLNFFSWDPLGANPNVARSIGTTRR
jgi:hypothetical protein